VVLREEQTGSYPPLNDPEVPDFNPKGCQKGACYAQRMYDRSGGPPTCSGISFPSSSSW